MASERLPNRWGIAVAAVIMQICLGAVYGWSVFKIPLMRTEHWSETQVQLNFTLAILFLGVGTIIGGLWQDRKGPRVVASVAGVVYGVGYLLKTVIRGERGRQTPRTDNRRSGLWLWRRRASDESHRRAAHHRARRAVHLYGAGYRVPDPGGAGGPVLRQSTGRMDACGLGAALGWG